MSMIDGMKKVAGTAIDTMDKVACALIAGGVEPREAVKAAAIFTKIEMQEWIDENYANQDAATITSSLSQGRGFNVLQ